MSFKGKKEESLPVCKYMAVKYYFQKIHASKSGIAKENGKLLITNYQFREKKNLKVSLISTYSNILG